MNATKLMAAAVVAALGISLNQSHAAPPAAAAAAPAAKAEGKVLFDGKSTKGWRGYKKSTAPKGWVVEDGILKGKGGGDLMTEGKYDYFELTLEWNLPKGGNSGIIYRVAETKGPSWSTGPEIQILSKMSPNSAQTAGSCYALYPPTKDVLKPNGQWNHVKLIIRPDNSVEHWMNGEKVCSYKIGSEDWQARVAKSKFSKMPQFGKIEKGHIVLQDHGNEIWFRNIRIRELN